MEGENEVIQGAVDQTIEQPDGGEVESPFEHHPEWSKDTRAAIDELLKAENGRRYAETFRKQWDSGWNSWRTTQSERDKYRAAAERWNGVIQPYEQQYRMSGMDPVNGVQQALAWAQAIQQNPQQTLQQLAQMYGVDFSKAKEDEPYVDPYVKQIEQQYAQRFGRIEQAINGVLGTFTQQSQSQALGYIEQFATATDESGNLLHPHFNDIPTDELVKLVNAGYPLDKAYQIACVASDDVRAKIEKAKAEKEAAARRVQAEKATAATAALSPKGKAIGKGATKPMSAMQAIEAAERELSS